MLRSFFIAISKAAWAQRTITHWGLAWRVASRFIAGDHIEDAIVVVKQLNAQGIYATLDHLGENTTSQAAAEQATAEILRILAAISAEGLQSNVSVKLSQLGLGLDVEVAYHNLTRLLDEATRMGNFVRVDMEDSTVTGITLELVERARKDGHNNLGTVIQSYLYRSEADVARLAALGVPVRLVKGAYNEPTQVAYPGKKDVDASFDRLAGVLLQAETASSARGAEIAGRFPPLAAVASHDLDRIRWAQEIAQQAGLPKDLLEFQMLYGIRRDLQRELARAGYPVRVYVPFGTHWYPYFMRRLAERPANVWFFLSNFFQR
jgi:proline dehydrogenase